MMDGCENIVPHHHNLITYTHIRQPTKIPSSVHSLCLCPSCPTLLYLIHLSLSLLSYCTLLYSTWSTCLCPSCPTLLYLIHLSLSPPVLLYSTWSTCLCPSCPTLPDPLSETLFLLLPIPTKLLCISFHSASHTPSVLCTYSVPSCLLPLMNVINDMAPCFIASHFLIIVTLRAHWWPTVF